MDEEKTAWWKVRRRGGKGVKYLEHLCKLFLVEHIIAVGIHQCEDLLRRRWWLLRRLCSLFFPVAALPRCLTLRALGILRDRL